jgi:lipoprotein-anchoring transpeptidase ErfK/SrfK
MTSLHPKLLKALAAMKFALAALVLLAAGAQARGSVGAEQGRIHIEINKGAQRMIVYVDGERRMTFRVSTGKSGHATPGGSFRALSMKEMHYSRKYDNAPMPHAIFFTSVGHAIHATTAVRNLGRPASHGCVRLSPRDAAALYALVARMGMRNVSIRIS